MSLQTPSWSVCITRLRWYSTHSFLACSKIPSTSSVLFLVTVSSYVPQTGQSSSSELQAIQLTFLVSFLASSLLTIFPSTSDLISLTPFPLVFLTATLAFSQTSLACLTSCCRLSQSGRGMGMRRTVGEVAWGVRLSDEA